MASSSSFYLVTFAIIFIVFIGFKPTISCFTSIVIFGDSLSDTGNYMRSDGKPDNVGHLPFGETYFHHPTGRYSDGRIVLDFIAEAMGLPHVPPFLGGPCPHEFEHGVNFAFGGATAIESSFFREKGLKLATNYSLDVQVSLYKELLPFLCPDGFADCGEILSKSLFFVGEIGGNDYHALFLSGRKLKEIETHVPRVIDAISSAIDELVSLGAKALVVPGYLPVGCLPGYLTLFPNSEKDRNGCIKWVNKFAEYHDRKLLQMLHHMRHRHPLVTIVYADYYNATFNLFRYPHHFGFKKKHLTTACCGGGGLYNYNMSVRCGDKKGNLCDDPSKFIIWDGMHLTEAAYRAIADQLIHGPLAVALISKACQFGFNEH